MSEIFNPLNALDNIQAFLSAGGNVLVVIMGVTFIMWALILERMMYFMMAAGGFEKKIKREWNARDDHSSWYAKAVREKMVSEVNASATQNMAVIKGLVAIAPLLGLLGTVTGMIEVFNVLAVTGSANPKLMAAGISKATIPTMAGLVASLSGIIMINVLDRASSKAARVVSEDLEVG